MSIFYRTLEVSDIEPSTPANGDFWIKTLNDESYQVYIYINEWLPIVGGGVYNSDLNLIDHRINVVIQEDDPIDFIKPGWLWIKESVPTAFWYTGVSGFEYVVAI